jgi:hypothetical protein
MDILKMICFMERVSIFGVIINIFLVNLILETKFRGHGQESANI